MKSSTKDQAEGDLNEMKGKAKEDCGQAPNNPELMAEGQHEKLGGKVQNVNIGQSASRNPGFLDSPEIGCHPNYQPHHRRQG
jgi:uncharacterized protein YjbJ (UPF0337 family)